MTPDEVLDRVLKAGGRLIADPGRPRLEVPAALKSLVLEHREMLRRLVLYQATLRRWWTLTAQGPGADPAEIAETYQEVLRLMDEVGEPVATRLRRQWARDWWQEIGVCPWCGERGLYHDPERGGEPA